MKHIPRFFVPSKNFQKDTASLSGPDLRQITSVLRLQPGDRTILLDGSGYLYEAELTEIQKEKAIFRLLSRKAPNVESEVRITLGAALLKGEKFHYLIQKAVELGVYAILPFYSTYTVAKIPETKISHRLERWQKIAVEAAEQSERGIVPRIHHPMPFDRIILEESALKLICMERGAPSSLKEILRSTPPPPGILVLVGPEGGFSQEEARQSIERGFCPISLGKRILRAETAAIKVLSNLLYELE